MTGDLHSVTTLVMFGLDCTFTRGVLNALASHGIRPALLVLPGPPGSGLAPIAPPPRRTLTLNVATPTPFTTGVTQPMSALAERTVRVGSPRNADLRRVIADMQPAAIAVACYLQRIPSSVTSLAPLALNLHPSLLPRHRGPDPLFWTFHAGDDATGITLHTLADAYDSGAIHLQERLTLPLDATEHDVETTLAARGGHLLAALLVTPDVVPTPTPQDEAFARYDTWPRYDDLLLTEQWTAQRAWRCLYGLRERALPFRYVDQQGTVAIDAPVRLGMRSEPAPTPQPGEHLLTFVDGWLLVRVRPE